MVTMSSSVATSIDEWNAKPFMRWAGLRVTHAHDGRATMELIVGEENRGGGGTRAVNGAILAYMHDVIQGVAITSLAGPSLIRMATLHLNIEYPRLLVAEHVAIVTASVLRLGRSVAFCDSEFRDAEGHVCSRSSGTYHVKRAVPQGAPGASPTREADH